MQAHGMTWLRCWTVAISFNGTRFDLTTISVFLGFALRSKVSNICVCKHRGVRAGWLPSTPVPARQEKIKVLPEDFAAHTLANTKAEVRNTDLHSYGEP